MYDPLQGRVDRTSTVPLGIQLVDRIKGAIAAGRPAPGERLPSVRELAEGAGVNVNTVRAAYARLEAEGLVRSEHGRGTFVAKAEPADASTLSRSELRAQIAALEATLARLPPPPLGTEDDPRRPVAALLSTDELLEVRRRLLERLGRLDTERTALIESLEQLGVDTPAAETSASRRATPSLAGARIRWVGA
jgi:DNA-binding transcriptional regulator YhcF (GntR family)